MYKIMIRSIFSSNKLNQITSETYESKQTFEQQFGFKEFCFKLPNRFLLIYQNFQFIHNSNNFLLNKQ